MGLLAGFAGFARIYLITFGIVYGLVTVLGFANVESVVRGLNINMADNFLHLGISTLILLFGLKREERLVRRAA